MTNGQTPRRELTDHEMEVWERLRALDEAQDDLGRRSETAVLFAHVVAAFDRLRDAEVERLTAEVQALRDALRKHILRTFTLQSGEPGVGCDGCLRAWRDGDPEDHADGCLARLPVASPVEEHTTNGHPVEQVEDGSR